MEFLEPPRSATLILHIFTCQAKGTNAVHNGYK